MNTFRILIIEDSRHIAKLLSDILVSNNYEVTDIASSGEDAVRIVEKNSPDLIIIDIKANGKIDGIDITKKINLISEVPVIFLTGSADGKNLKQIRKLSCNFLLKPFKRGDLLYAVKTSLFQTQQKKTETELRNVRDETQALLSSLVTILIGVSGEDEITYWNNIAETVFHIPASRIIGTTLIQTGIKWDWERIYEGISQSVTEKKPVKLDDLHFITPENKEGFLNIIINTLRDREGKLKGYLINGEDITIKKELEQQLAQAQKLESIGQLSSGIAHEINTPTQYITSNAYFLKDAFSHFINITNKSNDLVKLYKNGGKYDVIIPEIDKLMFDSDFNYLTNEVPKAIDQSIEGLGKVAKIVQSMKQFAHPESNEKIPVDINNAIENTITISRNEWKYVADVVTRYDENLPSVPCYPGRFNMVLLNIFINSVDAIRKKADLGTKGKGVIDINTYKEDKWIVIKIKDTGIGMPEDIKSKIFDPFFTTKEVDKGTGQGLPIAYDIIVNKHNGQINYISNEGIGTTFTIRLPAASGSK